MKALLLAGGFGTRMRPLTERLPKPMAPVGNRPWLEHLIAGLKEQGIREIVIAVKHYPERIIDHFGDGRKLGVDIRYTHEPVPLGTAGAVKNAESLLGSRFVVINADIVHRADIRALAETHARSGAMVTVGLVEVADPSQFGVVEQTEDGRIVRFVEKPPRGEAPSNRINAGIYIMERDVLREIPAGREVSIERETFPALIAAGHRVQGAMVGGYWMDMGTSERYRRIHWDLLDGKLELDLPGREPGRGIRIGEGTEIAQGAMLVPPVLVGSRVKIGERAVVGPYAVIGDDCVIGRGARVTHSILWDRCTAAEAAQLNRCIVGSGLKIDPRHLLHEAVLNVIPEAETI
jgi:Nucleoside-diphosphate-sugar pyrophosphorylase involved in lipopolysaccharide biosynthesis/translation initiation factor 2B, gamma/epsilon subunits (eIF-2Bgamma/eIF-2Bepsilon)